MSVGSQPARRAVLFEWSGHPIRQNCRNKVDAVGFSDSGEYVYSSRWYNFLTPSAMTGAGNPIDHLPRGPKSFQRFLGLGFGEERPTAWSCVACKVP